MRTVSLFTILCIILHIDLLAQEFKIPIKSTAGGGMTLIGFRGIITIEGYQGKEVIIIPDSVMKAPDKAAGLRPVYPDGVDNTGIGISLVEKDNKLELRYLLPLTHKQQYKIRIPEDFYIKLEKECGPGDIMISNVKGGIEIKTCQRITLTNVAGPAVLSTIMGNSKIIFNQLRKDKPTSLASVSGDIDVTLPAGTGVNLELKTMGGNVYSDFDFPAKEKDVKRVGDPTVIAQLNGGGADLKITTIRGNIYIRKSK